MHPVRCVGVADPAPHRLDTFVENAGRQGLTVLRGRGAAVAYDATVRPSITAATIEDGSFVLLDGEVFDATVEDVLAALRRGGIDALLPFHLEALVTWWDAPAGRVHVIRDQTGVVQGLLGRSGSSAVWSSDHASLLAAGVAPVHDPLALDQHIAVGWVTPPRSFLRDATTIAAGHVATFGPASTPEIAPWFLHTASPPLPADAASHELGEAIVAAVERRSRGGSLGATLSSGVDSAVVVAVLRKVLDRPVATFTFRYLGYDGQLNEDTFAAETARILGAPHHVIDVAPETLAEQLPAIVSAFQSPVTFGVHSFHQRAIRDAGVDVVLGGSDPGFWHVPGRAGTVASWLRALPAPARVALLGLTERLRRVPKGEAAHWITTHANHPMKNAYASLGERAAMFGASTVRASATELARAVGDATRVYRHEPAELRTAFVFEQWGIPQYVGQWNQQWGRSHGFPIRAPLWDVDVARVVDRRRPWTGDKPILRAFASTLLPHDRAHAPKVFQEMPLQHWFRGPLRPFVEDHLAPDRLAAAGIDPRGVRAVLDAHLAGANRQWPLWQVLSAVEWVISLRAPEQSLLGE